MSVFDELKQIEEKVKRLTQGSEKAELSESAVERKRKYLTEKKRQGKAQKQESAEEETEEQKMFALLSDDETIESFLESVLSTLGELEASGKIAKLETPEQTRAAMMAAVRRMYQKRGLVAKMSRLYNRFGATRILQRARRDIAKALT